MLDDLLRKISRFQFLDTPEKLAKFKRRLVVYILMGLAVVVVLKNLNTVYLSEVAVSADEQCIAFIINNGEGIHNDDTPYQILRCCSADGETLFESDLNGKTSGGNCAMWFEGDKLYLFTFRPHTILEFDLNGTYEEYASDPIPSPYPEPFSQFSQSIFHPTYKAQSFDLIYRKSNFTTWSGKPTELVLVRKEGTAIRLWSAGEYE